jgi:hypothetical protein
MWSVLIPGSMALKQEEDYFRNLVVTSDEGSMSIGFAWNILKVLEESWKTRGTKGLDGECYVKAGDQSLGCVAVRLAGQGGQHTR